MFNERNSKMKNILLGALISGFASLAAMDVVWEHDFHAGKSIRRTGDSEKIFDIRRERLNPVVESLPEGAEAGTWYPVMQTMTLDLRAIDNSEEVIGLPHENVIAELSFIILDGKESIHAHFGEPYEKISKLKKKKFFKCWECKGVESLVRVLKRAAGSAEEIIISETSAGIRHERRGYISDFTNPSEQDYGTGKITPAPQGVGGVNKQVLENNFKSLKGKLGI